MWSVTDDFRVDHTCRESDNKQSIQSYPRDKRLHHLSNQYATTDTAYCIRYPPVRNSKPSFCFMTVFSIITIFLVMCAGLIAIDPHLQYAALYAAIRSVRNKLHVIIVMRASVKTW
jgi:hypothetical protein